jgi:hypothetical protein
MENPPARRRAGSAIPIPHWLPKLSREVIARAQIFFTCGLSVRRFSILHEIDCIDESIHRRDGHRRQERSIIAT